MAGTHHRSHIMENVTLTPKEQSRLQVLNSLAAEHMTLDQAAELMGVTSRHTRRILAAYRERGAAALAHGHRGRRPVNATPEALVVDVAQLARTRYAGVNHTHLAELLAEREGIHIGRTTLRRVLLDAGLSSPRRRRPPKHRVRRQRMPQEGMLIQLDGSYHPWLGDQAPPFTLLIAVDDATGQVVSAWCCEHEDARSYFLLIRALVEHRGVPVALYTDRHAVFKHTPGPGLPAGPTQFSRAMDELGTQMIFAQSPQAKGRVERTGGTFQDRLVAELRLAGATTLEQAQAVLDEFVPRFNRRFGVPPQCSEPAFRPLDPELCLEQVLCFKHRRKVDRDNTVRFQLRTLQLLPAPERPSYAGATVEVLEGLDGQLKVRHEGRSIAAQEAPPSPVSLRNGHQPPAVSPVAPIGVNHWDERWTAHLAPLVSSQEPEADQPDCTDGEVAAAPPATVAPRRAPEADLPSEGEMDRGRDGQRGRQRERWKARSRKPGARACRCGQSNGSWASTGPPSGVIWRPEVLQDGSSGWCPIRRHRIPWQRNGVTFSLNTYPDIFPDLRQGVSGQDCRVRPGD